MTSLSANKPTSNDSSLSANPLYCLDAEFLVWTSDDEWVLDYSGWDDGTVEGPDEELEKEPDELWLWLGERDSPWPSAAEMERMFNASIGADLALALKN